MLNFVSVCSGIEGASVAWSELGWVARKVMEVDRDACKVLSDRWPEIENAGDAFNAHLRRGECEVLVGGTPCQSFSITGLRKGLDDDRGNLALQFFRLAREARPQWIIWENVPGVLSSNGGRDFGVILGALDELGYGWAYRVLDAIHFGVPQCRRRVYVVGHLGAWQPAAATLFDRSPLQESYRPAREIRASGPRTVSQTRGSDVLGFTGDETPKFATECVPTLRANQGGEGVCVVNGSVRRLSPVEWERLQGFPDGYTDVGLSDRVRQRLLGNAFCVPVVRWIGRRVHFLEMKS